MAAEIWHDLRMPASSKPKRLADAYRFLGFQPRARLRGVFGDRKARVITLVRRSKKRSVALAGQHVTAGMTTQFVVRATSPMETRASTSNSTYGASPAALAAK